MSDGLSSSFERLVGRKPSDGQRRHLYEVKEALQIGDNDALWSVLAALEHYEGLYSEHPARIAEVTRRALADVQRGFAEAAKVEARRAQRKLAELVAASAMKIADQRTRVARQQGVAVAAAASVLFGALCLTMGFALGTGRIPSWTHGTGARRLISAALGAPAGWVLLLLLLPAIVRWTRNGWAAARAPQASMKERMAGWLVLGSSVVAVVGLLGVLLHFL